MQTLRKTRDDALTKADKNDSALTGALGALAQRMEDAFGKPVCEEGLTERTSSDLARPVSNRAVLWLPQSRVAPVDWARSGFDMGGVAQIRAMRAGGSGCRLRLDGAQRLCLPLGRGLDRILYLLEGAHLDLAYAFAADVEFGRQLFKRVNGSSAGDAPRRCASRRSLRTDMAPASMPRRFSISSCSISMVSALSWSSTSQSCHSPGRPRSPG